MQAAQTVLVVDDDLALLESVSELLRSEGFHVVSTRDGREALAFASSHEVDALVTDLQMPGVDGWQLVKELRDRRPDLPVLVLSANERGALPSDIQVLAKPVGAERLLRVPRDDVLPRGHPDDAAATDLEVEVEDAARRMLDLSREFAAAG